MGKAKGKKGRRQQDSSDDDDFVDPIQAALAAGGAALLVLKVGSQVNALTAFTDPATGELRLVSGSRDKTVRVLSLIHI